MGLLTLFYYRLRGALIDTRLERHIRAQEELEILTILLLPQGRFDRFTALHT